MYRTDQSDGYGGVFIGCRSTFRCISIDIQSNSEIASCKVDLAEGSLLIIAAYRPPNCNLSSAEYLSNAIEKLILDHLNSTVWVAGDLNLPNIDWKTWTLNANNYPLALYNLFIDLFVTHGFSQLVNSPTRDNNILDILLLIDHLLLWIVK